MCHALLCKLPIVEISECAGGIVSNRLLSFAIPIRIIRLHILIQSIFTYKNLSDVEMPRKTSAETNWRLGAFEMYLECKQEVQKLPPSS